MPNSGTLVLRPGDLAHPDFARFTSDDGSFGIAAQQTDVTITLNAGISAVLVLDALDAVIQYTNNESGTFQYTIPASESGEYKFIVKTTGYQESRLTKDADGVNITLSAITSQDAQPTGEPMYTATTSALVNIEVIPEQVAPPQDPRLNIRIGDGAVSGQVCYDETEDALQTQLGLEYLFAGGCRTSFVPLPGGNYFFLGCFVRFFRDQVSDVNATVNVFAISADGSPVDGTNGGVTFLFVSDADKLAAHLGAVYIDESSAFSGTVFPTGTPIKPVNNIADAVVISEGLGLREWKLVSTVTVNVNVLGYTLFPVANFAAQITMDASANFDGSSIVNSGWLGDFTASAGGFVRSEQSTLIGVANLSTSLHRNCRLIGTQTIGAAANVDFFKVAANENTGVPVIDLQGLGDNTVELQDFSGAIIISGVSGSSEVIISGAQVDITLDASCDGGSIIVRGAGKLSDASTGSAVDSTGFNVGSTGGTVDANIVSVTSTAVTDVTDFQADTSALSTSVEIAGLNDFDPAADTVANVTLVATTTTNTDMRGNDAANTIAPDNATISAISVQTTRVDGLIENVGGDRYTAKALEEGTGGGSGLTAQETRDAMKLAPTAGAPGADSVDDKLDDLETQMAGLNDFDPATDAVANVTLVATTTTNTDMRGNDAANTIAPDNAGIATTLANTTQLIIDSAAILADLGLIQGTGFTTATDSLEAIRDAIDAGGIDAQAVRDAMLLAPTGTVDPGSIDASLAIITSSTDDISGQVWLRNLPI